MRKQFERRKRCINLFRNRPIPNRVSRTPLGISLREHLIQDLQELVARSRKPLSSIEPTRFDFNLAKIPLFSRSSPPLQAKLKVGEPNDVFEQEAERVADRVVNMQRSEVPVSPRAAPKFAVSSVQREWRSMQHDARQASDRRGQARRPHTKRLTIVGVLNWEDCARLEDEEMDVGGAGTSTAASHANTRRWVVAVSLYPRVPAPLWSHVSASTSVKLKSIRTGKPVR